jgi:hypothetical protein
MRLTLQVNPPMTDFIIKKGGNNLRREIFRLCTVEFSNPDKPRASIRERVLGVTKPPISAVACLFSHEGLSKMVVFDAQMHDSNISGVFGVKLQCPVHRRSIDQSCTLVDPDWLPSDSFQQKAGRSGSAISNNAEYQTGVFTPLNASKPMPPSRGSVPACSFRFNRKVLD